MNYEALRSEIVGNAFLRSMASMGNDQGIADWLNEKNIPVVRRISREALLRWGATTGALARIKQAMEADNLAIASAAAAGMAIIESGIEYLRIDSEVNTLLTALIAGGVLTTSDVTSMAARATETISRAEQLFGSGVSAVDVSRSLEPHRPDGVVSEIQAIEVL